MLNVLQVQKRIQIQEQIVIMNMKSCLKHLVRIFFALDNWLKVIIFDLILHKKLPKFLFYILNIKDLGLYCMFLIYIIIKNLPHLILER